MKSFLQKILASFARKIVKKYNPDIIAITGSVGKTTAKEAIVRVLSETFRVRGNEKSYNNELGVPLTIIGCHAPGRAFGAWIVVFLRAFLLLLRKERNYPSILVLEMGADAPGDIERLVSIAPPKIGVLTAIGPAHLEKFGTIERVIEEKMKIFSHHTSATQWMTFNADEPHLQQFCHSERSRAIASDGGRNEESRVLGSGSISRSSAEVSAKAGSEFVPDPVFAPVSALTFGASEAADLRISDISERYAFHLDQKGIVSGVNCTLTYKRESARAEFSWLVGRHVLSSVIAGAAVGCIYKIPLTEIVRRLHEIEPPPGRMHLIHGIKRTLIIDDTYNSSPNAARGAINVLMSFEIDGNARRIVVLGDMRELGEHAEKEHRTLGAYAAEMGVDYLFAVGENAKFLAEGARNLDASRIFMFTDSMSAGSALQDFMKQGDVILIKGSQNIIRLERAVKEIMAEPHRAKELLVRQDKEWM